MQVHGYTGNNSGNKKKKIYLKTFRDNTVTRNPQAINRMMLNQLE